MSFITKRERVFHEYDLFDLPARNEGKLKAYSSCTDARAWSHFCSDQTEHLVDIIKRNNEICRTKYVPTDVIVNTLMVAKNAEIGRLKRKIEEFEQMLAAYDQLDLTSEQKVEIANAHAAIKAANKELDDLCLDLDLSGFTEGVDSEAFETGKSRGDEPGRFRSDEIGLRTDESGKYRSDDSEKYRGDDNGKYRGDDNQKYRGDNWVFEKHATPITSDKSNQIELSFPRDASTNVHDPRIQQMQDTIISKDAKLNAMQNTIAVMENDVCEPYCIYAHIYTALEKIFGILCQNDKYKLYLNLMTVGNDNRCIDIKGKILYKLKVLEKFSLALIAPCSQEPSTRTTDCSCYRAEITQHVESTFALTCSESQQPHLDNKRALLVADIMENEEMKEILSKENSSEKIDDDQSKDNTDVDNYDIETENLKRLKNLQDNYDDLVTCYENLKYDNISLTVKCKKYEELDAKYEILRTQLKEYNQLWNEKEHYRKRSGDLDSLKEKFLILTDETTNLETQLKAESEINHIKTSTIEDLRSGNISMNKKFNETIIAFEKEKNLLECKLKETECKAMCQEQQIKSLTVQIDRLLEQDKVPVNEDPKNSILLIDEVESLKDQINNLKNALFCNEDEKHTLQCELQQKLKDINELRMAVEDWKSICEKSQQRNNHLQNYAQNYEEELHRLIEENRSLSQELEEKTIDLYNKSQENKRLINEIENNKTENNSLLRRFSDVQNVFERNVVSIENEKEQALQSLDLARQESRELLNKVNDYEDIVQKQDNALKTYEAQIKESNELKNLLLRTLEENKNLKEDIKNRENNDTILLEEIQKLRVDNNEYTVNNTNYLRDENKEYKAPLELTKKESKILEIFENLSQELHSSKSSHERLYLAKKDLKMELREKMRELADTTQYAHISKKENQDLNAKLLQSEKLNEEMLKVNAAYKSILNDNQVLQSQLSNKNKELNSLLHSLDILKEQNYNLLQKSDKLSRLEQEFKDLLKAYDELVAEKMLCQNNLDNKIAQLMNLNNLLENKVKENMDLFNQIQCLKNDQEVVESKLIALQNKNMAAQATLDDIEMENNVLFNKVKQYETTEKELIRAHEQLKTDKERLQNELDMRVTELSKTKLKNNELQRDSQTLLRHSENLEKLITKPEASHDPYSTIKKEIEDMKQEKAFNQSRIKELLDKLDDSDNIISHLSEDIAARDDKIAILENHINELEDEVRQLNRNLAEVVDAGEQIQQYSYEKIHQSLKNMEARHSRATHNMKIELVKLQNEKSILEEHLSATELKTKESATEKDKCISQFIQLQNEKEIIVRDIKQLELESVGASNLSQNDCAVEEILMSLNRIRKIFDAKNSKCNMLEQNLLKVQTSSQLLVSEAKGIVEKEKQKIFNEKEEAIRDKLFMQKLLEDQKAHLEKQSALDKTVIKDLEGELLNQKLIFDKINKSSQDYVSKLEEELCALQRLYQNSMAKISELHEKLQRSSEEADEQRAIIEKSNLDLEQKSKEITKLLNNLEELRNKPTQTSGIQVSISGIKRNTASQTDKDIKDSEHIMSGHIYENNLKPKKKAPNLGDTTSDKPVEDVNISGVLPIQKPHSVNEVQILTANIEPTFDFVRRNESYLKYRLKHLTLGRIEQHSILNDEFINEYNDGKSSSSDSIKIDNIYTNTAIGNPNVIDTIVEHNRQSPRKSSSFTELDFTNNSFITTNKNKPSSSSEKLSNKDFFIVYKDSEPNYLDEGPNDERLFNINRPSDALVGVVTAHSLKKTNKDNKNGYREKEYNKQSDISLNEEIEKEDNDSVKPKLHINLPRVGTDSVSLVTSEGDKKSLDSYTIETDPFGSQITISHLNLSKNRENTDDQDSPSLPSLLSDEGEHKKNSKSLKTPLFENKSSRSTVYNKTHLKFSKKMKRSRDKERGQIHIESPENESHHKLSRVEADVFQINPKRRHDKTMSYKDNCTINYPRKSPQNFGLEYILNTVQRELDPEVNATKILRKTRSDERFNQLQAQYFERSSSPSPLLKQSTLECKIDSSYDHTASETSQKSQLKSLAEHGVMTDIDYTQDYESKLNYMSKVLGNIEKEYKNKIEVIKVQYDNNIKNIINEHNQGVKNIQNLHEETLQDILKGHENEVENLTTLSMEAMRKAEKLEKENQSLKSRIQLCSYSYSNEESGKMPTADLKKRKKYRTDTKLTKTNVEAFNVKPKCRSHGPCTCSLDVNVSDTIRNIFEQVDAEQRKIAEHAYMKYIVEKIITKNVEALDTHELTFLHLKVCRTWKMKLNKEEVINKGIGTLEHEVMNKQRNAQEHIAALDRQVAEERRRLQEVRESVCCSPAESNCVNPEPESRPGPPPAARIDICNCNNAYGLELGVRQSAGDLLQPGLSGEAVRPRRIRTDINRVTDKTTCQGLSKETIQHEFEHFDELGSRVARRFWLDPTWKSDVTRDCITMNLRRACAVDMAPAPNGRTFAHTKNR